MHALKRQEIGALCQSAAKVFYIWDRAGIRNEAEAKRKAQTLMDREEKSKQPAPRTVPDRSKISGKPRFFGRQDLAKPRDCI